MAKVIPSYDGELRSHSLQVPHCISQCSGIRFFGRRIKSLVFSTDVAIIKNINADAVMAVYSFTPQPIIMQAIISVSDMPVFTGVGGGITNGRRSAAMALFAEQKGAYGVVCNEGITAETIRDIKQAVDIPVLLTVVSEHAPVEQCITAGADVLNVCGATDTPRLVRLLRSRYPNIPIIATGGTTDDSITATIKAGANAITYTPPSSQQLLGRIMKKHRSAYEKNAT